MSDEKELPDHPEDAIINPELNITPELKPAPEAEAETSQDDSGIRFPDFDYKVSDYPLTYLPQTIQAAAIELIKNDHIPAPLAVQAVLAAVSLVCQALLYVSRGIRKGERTVCSLFFLAVVVTTARKSTADDQVLRLIKGYDNTLRYEYDKAYAAAKLEITGIKHEITAEEKSETRLIGKIGNLDSSGKDGADELKKKAQASLDDVRQKLTTLRQKLLDFQMPTLKRVFYSNVSVMELQKSMAKSSPAVGLFSDEAAGILGSKSTSDMANLDSLYDGTAVDVGGSNTGQTSFFVPDPRLTLSLMMQPVAFDDFVLKKGELAKGLGFLGRVLMCRPEVAYGDRTFQRQENKSTDWLDLFNDRALEILKFAHVNMKGGDENRVTLHFDPEAQKYWEEMYNNIEAGTADDGALEDVREFAGRYGEHVARLAALFHFFESWDTFKQQAQDGKAPKTMTIPKHTVEAADKLVGWYLAEFRRVFDPQVQMREKGAYVLKQFKSLLDSMNGRSTDYDVTRVPLQELRARCHRYGLEKIAEFRPVAEWLHRRGNITVYEAKRRDRAMVDTPPLLLKESVEINSNPYGEGSAYCFDIDSPGLRPRQR